MKGLNWKTVLTGFAFYLVTLGIMRWLIFHDSPPFFFRRMLNGHFVAPISTYVISTLSGYFAASSNAAIAIKNSVVCGFLIILSVILLTAMQLGLQNTKWLFSCFLISVARFLCTIFGGYLRSRRQPRLARPVSEVLQPPIPLP